MEDALEKSLEKYCMEMMKTYGGHYAIYPDLNAVVIYKGDIQELDSLSFEDVLKELQELELEEEY